MDTPRSVVVELKYFLLSIDLLNDKLKVVC